jgi:predicted pyridoxine 5'-phosphate oxidase superfamily flavin-nucleotide-binding protein
VTGFDTPITLTGPWRSPAQMLADQAYDGHASVHDDATAASLGLAGAPIEAPTHFSQFDPLACTLWGEEWFRHGCISAHFQTMVVEGEEVQASLTTDGTVEARKRDGTPVLTGTASLSTDGRPTELDQRRARLGDPGELFIIDQLAVGMRSEDERPATVTRTDRNGAGYPFSLDEKLARITEPHPWYTDDGAAASPWGRAILPVEMISVLTSKSGPAWPVRSPALGLFLDLEIRLLDGPVFVGEEYRLTRELVGLSQSRRTESYWTRTTVIEAASNRTVAEVVLHAGVFKESYPGYPRS